MTIIFLCGSLEKGKDGVGDYIRRLAAELIRLGHQCHLIALMDRFIEKKVEDIQVIEGISINVIRLPFNKGYRSNCITLKKRITSINPDWISLHFVPFSFHDKGLPFRLGKYINQLRHRRKLHIMFHELWVGINKEASITLKVWGNLQKLAIRSMLKICNPDIIHTNTSIYKAQLKKIGFIANVLPLFGNIPIVNPLSKNIEYLKVNNKKKFSFVFFGSIHSGSPIAAFIKEIKKFEYFTDKEIEIILIGRCGIEQENWISSCLAEGITVKNLGEQPVSKISEVLSLADLGISTTPFLLSEKSGTVAAMLEHGLSVVCVAKAWTVKGFTEDYTPIGVHIFNGKELAKCLPLMKEENQSVNVKTVSHQLIKSLNSFK